ncbi:MAG: glycoside hydrolase family 5 protein [Oscillospiraceae bacterium]
MKQFKGYMRGVNLGGWLSQCVHTSEHYSSFITEEDIKAVSLMGADHVRLPIDYEAVETADGQPLAEGLAHIDNCIEWCKQYGLNVILDVHKTAGFLFDDAEHSTLFDSEELMQRYLMLWERLSLRYGKCANLAFELLNEIVENTPERWNALALRAIQTIRRNAPNTKIIIGGIQWNSVHTLRLLDKPYDENIVFNFHFYEPFLFTHQSAPWLPVIPKGEMNYPATMERYRKLSEQINCFGSGLKNTDEMGAEFMELLILEAVNAAENAGVPLYCGEYGVDDLAPIADTLEWFKDIHSVFEKYGIGRAVWTYKSMDFGITDEHYSSIFGELTKLL